MNLLSITLSSLAASDDKVMERRWTTTFFLKVHYIKLNLVWCESVKWLLSWFHLQEAAVFIHGVNTVRRGLNDQHFTDDIFKCIFFSENVLNSIQSLILRVPWTISIGSGSGLAPTSHYLNQWWPCFPRHKYTTLRKCVKWDSFPAGLKWLLLRHWSTQFVKSIK